MARILKARRAGSQPTTPRNLTASQVEFPWHDPRASRKVRGKARIRRLMRFDPAAPMTRPEVDQFTDNANPNYDPSKSPGSVRKMDGTPQPPKGSTSGHQKVIRPARTGGVLRLRRR